MTLLFDVNNYFTLAMDNLMRIIGNPIEDFVGRKLPSITEVLSVFLHQHTVLKVQYKRCLIITISKVEEKWSQAGIPTCGKKYAVKKLRKLLDEVKKLRKNSKRKQSVTQKTKESIFCRKSKNLFDIARLNVEKYINEDKKIFLAGQRSNSRFGLIDNVTSSQSEEENEEVMVVDSAGKFFWL